MATTLLPADHLGLPATAAPTRRVAAALLSLCSLAADHPSMFEGCCGWRMEVTLRSTFSDGKSIPLAELPAVYS